MIISYNQGGLCNRIKSWISCQRYSVENNLSYKIIWKVIENYDSNNHILNCKFKDLFQNDVELNFNPKEKIIRYNLPDFIIIDNDNLPHNFSKFKSNCKKQFVPKDKFKRNIDFEYLRIPDNVIQNYLPYFQNIKLIPELDQKINEFCKNFNSNTISLHIRSWNLPNEEGRKNLLNINKIKKKLKTLNQKQIFLVTDNNKLISEFSEFNIITYPRKSKIDRNSTLSIQEDLIELYLLSKNKTMILSHFSTFSEVAWWLGGCSKDVTVI
jgi:hypothetical protein